MQSVSVHSFFYTTGSVRPSPCFFKGWQVRMFVIQMAKNPKIGKIGVKIVRPFIKNLGVRIFLKIVVKS